MASPLTKAQSNFYIGLMSGTSMDSIDAVLVDLGEEQCRLINAINFDIPPALQKEIGELCNPGANEIERMGVADRQLGRAFAEATRQLLTQSNITNKEIRAIGSHGQTIRHRPNQNDNNFTLQIGDPNTIAEETGITTVADFRRRDIAANGQGAPLAPAFHQAMFNSNKTNRAIINIGGMANITLLNNTAATIGFDTGPGNVLMDGWIQQNKQLAFDKNGDWATSGKAIPELLDNFLMHPYLNKPIPKSTGREEFNAEWLHQQIKENHYVPQDVQATLLTFTATTITNEINKLSEAVDEVYICGGGAYNTRLMHTLNFQLQPRLVATTESLGIAPEWVEGAAFAWLAKQTLDGLPGNLASVTGAKKDVILGAIYQA